MDPLIKINAVLRDLRDAFHQLWRHFASIANVEPARSVILITFPVLLLEGDFIKGQFTMRHRFVT